MHTNVYYCLYYNAIAMTGILHIVQSVINNIIQVHVVDFLKVARFICSVIMTFQKYQHRF